MSNEKRMTGMEHGASPFGLVLALTGGLIAASPARAATVPLDHLKPNAVSRKIGDNQFVFSVKHEITDGQHVVTIACQSSAVLGPATSQFYFPLSMPAKAVSLKQISKGAWVTGMKLDALHDAASPAFREADIVLWTSFCRKMYEDGSKGRARPARRIWGRLDKPHQRALSDWTKGRNPAMPKARFLAKLNEILRDRDLYNAQAFVDVTLGEEAQSLLRQRAGLQERQVMRLNRLLLEAAYPEEIAKSQVTRAVLSAGRARADLDQIGAKGMGIVTGSQAVLRQHLQGYLGNIKALEDKVFPIPRGRGGRSPKAEAEIQRIRQAAEDWARQQVEAHAQQRKKGKKAKASRPKPPDMEGLRRQSLVTRLLSAYWRHHSREVLVAQYRAYYGHPPRGEVAKNMDKLKEQICLRANDPAVCKALSRLRIPYPGAIEARRKLIVAASKYLENADGGALGDLPRSTQKAAASQLRFKAEIVLHEVPVPGPKVADEDDHWDKANVEGRFGLGIKSLTLAGTLDPNAGDFCDWWDITGFDVRSDSVLLRSPRGGVCVALVPHTDAPGRVLLRVSDHDGPTVKYRIELRRTKQHTNGFPF